MTKEFKVGILVLVAGILFYFGYHYLKGNDLLSSEAVYQTRFNKIEGLQASSPILLNGFKIGQVEKMVIEHDKKDSILVYFRVKAGVKIGDSTIAYLKSAGPLAGQIISIELGNSTNYFEGDTLIPSISVKGLMEIITEQTKHIEVLVNKVSAVTDEDSHLRSKLKSTLDNIELTTKNTAHLFGNLDQTYSKQQKNIEAILENFKHISQEFKNLPDSLKIAIGEASVLLDSLNNVDYSGLVNNIDSVMVNMQYITGQLADSNNSIGALLNEKEMYNNLNKTLLDLDFVIVDFQANPSKYTSISVFGKQPKNEQPIIKSVNPKSISSEVILKLYREVPAMFKVSLYDDANKNIIELDETTYQINRKDKTVTISLPSDLVKGQYILHAVWLGASSGQSVSIEVQ